MQLLNKFDLARSHSHKKHKIQIKIYLDTVFLLFKNTPLLKAIKMLMLLNRFFCLTVLHIVDYITTKCNYMLTEKKISKSQL
jgi:hypothetical protein